MPTARFLYNDAKKTLAAAGYTAAVEARVLFELAAGRRYADTDPGAELGADTAQRLEALVRRRVAGEPLQYLAGRWPFLDVEIEVGPGVLIPRPETEDTARKAMELAAADATVLDLCSGSGCIAIALKRARPGADVTAVELSTEALGYLKSNVARLAPGVRAMQADVLGLERELADESVDLIVANPPYVTPDEYEENLAELRHEPQQAFLGGADGLDFYRYIIAHYKEKLVPDGAMLFETGFNQTEAVAALFAQRGYRDIHTETDDFGLPRMVWAKR